MDRWTKNQIRLHERETLLHYAVDSNTIVRYEDIMQKYIDFAEIGAISQVKHDEVVYVILDGIKRHMIVEEESNTNKCSACGQERTINKDEPITMIEGIKIHFQLDL